MKSIKLNSGVQMPLLGFGTYQITEPSECKQTVKNALNVGYRLIDTAAAYGNEAYVGQAIKESSVKRDEVFLTTKLWFNDFENPELALENSLKKLGVDYIDLVLLHWPYGNTYKAYRALETAFQKGFVRAIGVSNYAGSQLIDLIHFNKIVPAVNQIETNLLSQQQQMHELMAQYGVQHQGYAPFGQGQMNSMFNNKILVEIADQYNKTTHQIALKFFVQQGIAVIPKSIHLDRMKDNLNIDDFTLTQQEITSLKTLDTNIPLIGNPQSMDKTKAAMQW
ncbi:aldo/keto reductase [Levilactobacillus acidifarinae]|uniref:NADP-dependent oxidoreductase domain-containing protein n=1 Tax=Levilactobacillus acidifarinae DSM 19394 = JCM 15949 TaxID=1423715 RepID=A0A0R1LF21_9LACO|nr:aldo/keto reductase [Levilactobacillus acidifarinae]KRK94427.1 hypothetical protein FD25_GL000387 [Levilactobacillus acidifarinae DSM 19394]GEO68168.1 2,5-diketo-D-gluconic acid reductase [Levilactobacillus acidifarinae]